MNPWRHLSKPEQVRIIAPDGHQRCSVTAYFAGSIFFVEDMKADMEPGDELRRTLPNGKDDVFNIDDPTLFDTRGMTAHYQVKVSRKGTFAPNTGRHIIHVNGPNARVNIGSTDNSTNVSHSGPVFGDMRQAVEHGVEDSVRRAEILAAIDEAERAKGTGGFLAAYQKLVSVAADYIGILSPFIPALTAMLT